MQEKERASKVIGFRPEVLSSQIVNAFWSRLWCWGPQRFRKPL